MNTLGSIAKKLDIYGWDRFAKFAVNEVRYKFYYQAILASFSQYKEDIVIDGLLKKDMGFYVDVGANDPVRFNNTYRFYRKGWQGINIDPNREAMNNFISKRSRDVNLNIGIDRKSGWLLFYEMFPETLSTFSKKAKDDYVEQGYGLKGVRKIPVMPLAKVLDRYAEHRAIDFFTIDTEGYDLQVLESNNWYKYRPKVICIESFEDATLSAKLGDRQRQARYLEKLGYKKVFDYHINSIYLRS